MSLIKCSNGDPKSEEWSLLIDTGETSNVVESVSRAATNGAYIYVAAEATLSPSAQEGIYMICLSDYGDMQWENIISDAADTSAFNFGSDSSRRENIALREGASGNPSSAYLLAGMGSTTYQLEMLYDHSQATPNNEGESSYYNGQASGTFMLQNSQVVRYGDWNEVQIVNFGTMSETGEFELDISDQVYGGASLSNSDFVLVGTNYTTYHAPGVWVVDSDYSTINAQKSMYVSTNAVGYVFDAAVDPSDNIYVLWLELDYDTGGVPETLYLTKFNSSLTEQWSIKIGTDSVFTFASAANVTEGKWSIWVDHTTDEGAGDPTDEVYVMIAKDAGDGAYVAEYAASNGSLNSQIEISGDGSGVLDWMQMTGDSNGLVITGRYNDGTYNNGIAVLRITPNNLFNIGTEGVFSMTSTSVFASTSASPTISAITTTGYDDGSNTFTDPAGEDSEVEALSTATTQTKENI